MWHKPNPQSWLGWRRRQRFVYVNSSKQAQHLQTSVTSLECFSYSTTDREGHLLSFWAADTEVIHDLDILWFQGWHLWSGHALILVASCFWCQQWDGETGRSPTKGTQINVCRSLNTSHRIWARHCEPINHCLHLYQQKTLDFPQFYIYRRGLIGRLNLIFY